MLKLSSFNRIVVYGAPGSGKTSLALFLAKKLGITYYSLDDLFWKEGWIETSDEEFIEKVTPIVQSDRWILDGNYKIIRPLALKKAEIAIILKTPFIVCIARLIKRTVLRNLRIKNKSLTPLPKNIRRQDIKLRHIIPTIFILGKSAWKFRKKTFHMIFEDAKEYLGEKKIIVLKNSKKIEEFL